MKLGISNDNVVGYNHKIGRWINICPTHERTLLDLIADPVLMADAQKLIDSAINKSSEAPIGLPFRPESLRAFAIWESHMINGARGMVRKFAPRLLNALISGYEAITRNTFPALKPGLQYYRYPQFYMSNHRSILPDGAEVIWPSYCSVLDFEMEIGVVIVKEVRDCSSAEGLEAIGGFVVMNDWSARDAQWQDTRHGTFGGVVKAKTFAGAMSAVLVTADEILPHWKLLRGRVRINGEVWCEGNSKNPLYDLGDMVAYAAMGESLRPGDVLATGTLPGCCGLEIGCFPSPGDTVQLEIDGIGSLTNVVGQRTL